MANRMAPCLPSHPPRDGHKTIPFPVHINGLAPAHTFGEGSQSQLIITASQAHVPHVNTFPSLFPFLLRSPRLSGPAQCCPPLPPFVFVPQSPCLLRAACPHSQPLQPFLPFTVSLLLFLFHSFTVSLTRSISFLHSLSISYAFYVLIRLFPYLK